MKKVTNWGGMTSTWPPAGTACHHRTPGGGLFMEHICPGGKEFHSRRELRDYCKKHSLEAEVLT